MSDAGPPVLDSDEQVAPPQPARARKPGMLADPVVRNMALAAFAMVILFLALVMGVVLSGVTAPSGPRTLSENEVSVSGAAVRKGSTDSATWGTYISALIANGQYSQAKRVIEDAKASVDDSATAEFAVAEIRLSNAQKNYEQSITIASKAQKDIETVHQATLDGGGLKAKRAKLDGLYENWYILALLKADAYRAMGDSAKAVAEMDSYLVRYPAAADILIDRGNAKIEIKDNAGAEADFRAALKFVPGDPEALAGLAKIGATDK